MLDSTAFAIPESVDYGNSVVATYLYRTPAHADIDKLAAGIAEEQSTGTWVSVSGQTEGVLRRHAAGVVALWEVPDHEMAVPEGVAHRDWVLQIAYPVHNFGAQIPLMLATVYGEIASAGQLKLIDLHLPPSFVGQFKGPRFGIDGMRRLQGVPERPLLLAITKPPVGLTAEQSAEAFYEAALGGADAVKDDEKVVSHPWSDLLDRVRRNGAAAKAAYEQTGHHTLYFANITDRPDRLVENAYRAVEAGASGLLVDYLVVGISALSVLADDPNVNVPILAHLAFSGAIYTPPWTGVSSHLILGKLPRLAGADTVIYPSPYGKLTLLASKNRRIARALTGPFYGLARTWPIPAGGVYPGMVPLFFQDLGRDFVAAAGGAIFGHPMGAAAGARAMRQAIDATLAGISLHVAAEQQPELKTALDLWGVPDSRAGAGSM